MRARTLYAIVGGTWGLVIGLPAALMVVAMAAGAAWLFAFGDDPWPVHAAPLLLLPGLGAFAVVVAAAILIAVRHGRRVEAMAPEQLAGQRRRAYRLLALALVAGATLSALAAGAAWRQAEERNTANAREAWFERLLAARQVLGPVVVRQGADGVVVATIATAGRRPGLHGLRWRLREPRHGRTLAAGERELRLRAGQNTVELSFDGLALARAYLDQVLAGSSADVMVDDSLELELRLEPRLSEADLGRLPAREAHNLGLGDSALGQTVSGRVRLAFERRGGVPRLLP